jgi:two-component system alkaline phosphatase synthesis response regulator PhoP
LVKKNSSSILEFILKRGFSMAHSCLAKHAPSNTKTQAKKTEFGKEKSGKAKFGKIVLIEDEEDIIDLVSLQAEISGYELVSVSDGLNGYELVLKEKPDLILLDIMLPGQNGLDVCRKIKAHPLVKMIPIIMISARSEETDVVVGLELGADDYVTKPFSPKVLFSRINALFRRTREEHSEKELIIFGEFVIDVANYLVRKKEKTVPLTLSEFGILRRLAASRGKVLTRNQLLDELQNEDAFVVDRNIDVHIASLRKKLGPRFDYIETVRGVGYRFRQD